MAQLKMYRFPDTPYKDFPLPEGYSVSNYKGEEDKMPWVECCRNGLCGDDEGAEAFDNAIFGRAPDLNPYEDVFFLDYNGEHIGTVTAYVHKDENEGDMHMVAIRTDFRGRGLSKYLSIITCRHLDAKGVRLTHLTTDEWRKPAIKGYLNYGFRPVEYDEGMVERWQGVLKELGIESVDMYNDDGSFFRKIFAE